MKPDRHYTLPGRFECTPTAVAAGVWQDHLVRHPLGVHRKSFGNRVAPWNYEGWDLTKSAVITEARRAKLLRAIGQLGSDGAHCLVPEFRNGTAPSVEPTTPYCKRCDGEVRASC